MSNSGWSIFSGRVRQYQRMRQLRACRRRKFSVISGGAGQDEELRQSVRVRLSDGRLFPADGVSVARRGSGRPCGVCGRGIEATQEERQVEGWGEMSVLVHDACYRIWREESCRPSA